MFTKEDAIAQLKDVAQGREGYVYELPVEYLAGECAYSTPGGEPSCLVGQVLYKYVPGMYQHIHEEEWDRDEVSGVLELHAQGVFDLQGSFYKHYDEEAVVVLQLAQNSQDDGSPWGEAIASAEKAYIG